MLMTAACTRVCLLSGSFEDVSVAGVPGLADGLKFGI